MSIPSSLGPLEADARSLAEKLVSFASTLSPHEAAILALAIRGAPGEAPEVQGHGWWQEQSDSDWLNALTKALLDMALANGAPLDGDTLIRTYAPDRAQQPRAAAESPATS